MFCWNFVVYLTFKFTLPSYIFYFLSLATLPPTKGLFLSTFHDPSSPLLKPLWAYLAAKPGPRGLVVTLHFTISVLPFLESKLLHRRSPHSKEFLGPLRSLLEPLEPSTVVAKCYNSWHDTVFSLLNILPRSYPSLGPLPQCTSAVRVDSAVWIQFPFSPSSSRTHPMMTPKHSQIKGNQVGREGNL